jgi:hypothetical protein
MVLVAPVVVLAILGGTVGVGSVFDDIFLWLLASLVLLMAICLIVGLILGRLPRNSIPAEANPDNQPRPLT